MTSYVYHYRWPNGSQRAQRGYVGKANDPAGRLRNHLKGKGSSLVVNAVRKYGAPEMEMWACDGEDQALELEVEKIKELGTRDPSGYNLTDGGEGIQATTEQRREWGRRGWKNGGNWTKKTLEQQAEFIRQGCEAAKLLSKLSDRDARMIRMLHRFKRVSPRRLAEVYGVNPTSIYRIINWETHK